MRRIEVWDESNEKGIVFLTNRVRINDDRRKLKMEDLDLFQNQQTEYEGQNFFVNLPGCALAPDLDRIDCSPASELLEVSIPVPVVAIESGGNAPI